MRKFVEFSKPNLTLQYIAATDYDEDDNAKLGLFGLYIKLPWMHRHIGGDPMWVAWGFSMFEGELHLSWGDKTKIFNIYRGGPL
jgi:hypothetical protein